MMSAQKVMSKSTILQPKYKKNIKWKDNRIHLKEKKRSDTK